MSIDRTKSNPLHQLIAMLRAAADSVERCHQSSTGDQLRAAMRSFRDVRWKYIKRYDDGLGELFAQTVEQCEAWLNGRGMQSAAASADIENAARLAIQLVRIIQPARHHALCNDCEDQLERLNREGEIVDAARDAERRVRVLAARTGEPVFRSAQGGQDSSSTQGEADGEQYEPRAAPGARNTEQSRKSKTRRPQGSKCATEKRSHRDLFIAILLHHHKYEDGSCLNWEPITVNVFAKANNIGSATVTKYLKMFFGGHAEYAATCRNNGTKLITTLKFLNDDYSPLHCYGGKPPGEGGHEDE